MSIGAMLANLKIHKLPNLKIRLVTYERREVNLDTYF